jgi:hypothetical protein
MHGTQINSAGSAAISPRFVVPHDENSFTDWLVDAKPGARTIYYRGHLAHDRTTSAAIHDRQARNELSVLSSRVMLACEQGLVHLVQKKLGPEDFLYFAVRASKRGASAQAARIPLGRIARAASAQPAIAA